MNEMIGIMGQALGVLSFGVRGNALIPSPAGTG